MTIRVDHYDDGSERLPGDICLSPGEKPEPCYLEYVEDHPGARYGDYLRWLKEKWSKDYPVREK